MERDHLLDLLVQYSYEYRPEASFRLSSGRVSNFYVNCKATTMRKSSAPLIARVFESKIPDGAAAVGGLTMGADPIAYAIRDLSDLDLDAFVVRKEQKEHGLGRVVEGPVEEGTKVVVVDDVVTTGMSTGNAIRACRDFQLDVVAVILLVDRQEDDGLAKIREEAGRDVPVGAIFNQADLHARWEELASDHGGSTATRPGRAAIG